MFSEKGWDTPLICVFPPPIGGQLTVQWLHFAMCVIFLRKAVTKDTFLGKLHVWRLLLVVSNRACNWTIIQKAASWRLLNHLQFNAPYVLLKVVIYTTILRCSDDVENVQRKLLNAFQTYLMWISRGWWQWCWIPSMIEGVFSCQRTLHGRTNTCE